MTQALAFRCPLCEGALVPTGTSLRCEAGHLFDCAREGYVNLLPVQNKRSLTPGDSIEMLQARRAFLEEGHYRCLVSALKQQIAKTQGRLLDLGCGEGYYLAQAMEEQGFTEFAAIDIAKAAVKMAAKRCPQAKLAVASSARLPFFANSFDCIVCVFSPIDADECARVLKPGGILVLAGPGSQHLQQLAAVVYGRPQQHRGNFTGISQSPLFVQENSHSIEVSLKLESHSLQNLLKMTPYYWHCSDSTRETLRASPALSIDLHFLLHTYRCVKSDITKHLP